MHPVDRLAAFGVTRGSDLPPDRSSPPAFFRPTKHLAAARVTRRGRNGLGTIPEAVLDQLVSAIVEKVVAADESGSRRIRPGGLPASMVLLDRALLKITGQQDVANLKLFADYPEARRRLRDSLIEAITPSRDLGFAAMRP